MGSLTISVEILNRYFRYLEDLDKLSKRSLILKLRESMKVEKPNRSDLKDIFGAWEDDASSDEIIRRIRDSRVEKPNFEDLD